MKISRNRIRLISYLVVIYVISAIIWWTVLLFKENKETFELYDAIRTENVDDFGKNRLEQIRSIPEEELLKRKSRIKTMILSEALVFILFLILGWWLMNRGYQSLVHAERIKKNFLLSISHELKSPLASIRLAFESLARLDHSEPKIDLVAHQGLAETNRLNDLVTNVLLTTRLDDNYRPDISRIQIKPFLDDIVERHRNKYPDADIKVHMTSEEDTHINIDLTALEIIFNNLIENALKYSKSNPTVDIKLELYDHKLYAEIADTGIGIPESELNIIFERFYRIGSESKRKTKGTGLGLYLVKKLIEWNEGQIEVKSKKGHGTTFKFSIPTHKSA